MKNFRKLLLVVLSVLCCSFFAFGLTACNNDNSSNANQENKDILAVYNMYVAYAEENNTTPLSYEDWLLSIKGEKGDKGDTGEQGIQGETGPQGPQGEKGDTGSAGTNGINGTNGVDGKSAYQIWLDNGNTGSETDFLNWLKGKDGTNGTNGTNGVNGLGIKNVEINDDGDLIVTFDDDTFINAGNVVNPNIKLNENNKITFNTLTITENNVYGKVSNDTETYSFINEIELIGNVGYTIYTDLQGTNSIPTKTVNLEIGDNTFYILETCGNDSNLYTVTIRRKPVYTVSFVTTGENEIPTQQVEEDSLATKPILNRNGYGWSFDFDFNTPITQTTTITATEQAIFVLGKLTTGTGIITSITGLTDYGKSLTEIYIPKEIDNVEITQFAQQVFSGATALKKVIVDCETLIYWNFGSKTIETIVLTNSIKNITGPTFSESYALKQIIYQGTKEEFNLIQKNENWLNGSKITTIICNDGEISFGE